MQILLGQSTTGGGFVMRLREKHVGVIETCVLVIRCCIGREEKRLYIH